MKLEDRMLVGSLIGIVVWLLILGNVL